MDLAEDPEKRMLRHESETWILQRILRYMWTIRHGSGDMDLAEDPEITYGPHKAVAEVSNHNEPIGRKSEIQLVRKSMDFTFSCFVLN